MRLSTANAPRPDASDAPAPEAAPPPPPAAGESTASAAARGRLPALTVAALGIVYGDIGTSPLYTMREALGENGVLPLTEASVLGVLSLIFWALFLVVTLKYVIVILRADNRGEGGILALASLAHRAVAPRRSRTVVMLAMLGAALFYGDGLITPAISVLSAIEGLKVATPLFEPYVVPIALGILIALFVVQSRGTGRIGLLFGPVVCLWFLVLGYLGLVQIMEAPDVLRALDPRHGLALFAHHRWSAFVTPKLGKGWELLLRHDHHGERARNITGVAYWIPDLKKVTAAVLVDRDSLSVTDKDDETRYAVKMLLVF